VATEGICFLETDRNNRSNLAQLCARCHIFVRNARKK